MKREAIIRYGALQLPIASLIYAVKNMDVFINEYVCDFSMILYCLGTSVVAFVLTMFGTSIIWPSKIKSGYLLALGIIIDEAVVLSAFITAPDVMPTFLCWIIFFAGCINILIPVSLLLIAHKQKISPILRSCFILILLFGPWTFLPKLIGPLSDNRTIMYALGLIGFLGVTSSKWIFDAVTQRLNPS